jgi:hypothetical protein
VTTLIGSCSSMTVASLDQSLFRAIVVISARRSWASASRRSRRYSQCESLPPEAEAISGPS